jgi:ATP-dependent Lhr-like helicase
LPRFLGGRKVPLPVQRMRAEDLLAAVFPEAVGCQENLPADIPIPDHPLVRETMRDVLHEALDLAGLERVLARIASGEIRAVAVDTAAASPFSQEILNANPYAFLDDAPLEERRARAVSLRRALPEETLGEIGRLDAEAAAETARQAWPDVRNAEELHDALVTFVAFPEQRPNDASAHVMLEKVWRESLPRWAPFFESLLRDRRVTRVLANGRSWWVPAERLRTFIQIVPSASFEFTPPAVESGAPTPEEALARLVIGWAGCLGPFTGADFAACIGLTPAQIEGALLHLESSGAILRGHFTGGPTGELEWCERRILARIHRRTLARLRREIEPVSPAQFLRWLCRWQHVAPGTQQSGERGLIEAVRQLQGFEAPASAWESQILPRRIQGYDPKLLDTLCLRGIVGWGRLRPHPATVEAGAPRRVAPSSVAPIALFLREESDWLALAGGAEHPAAGLGHAARDVLAWLERRGASFFADIVRGSGRLKAEVEAALWELVAAGRVTADDFDNLRALLDPRRRAGIGRARALRPRHSTGRWSLLEFGSSVERSKAVESACRMLLDRYGVVFRELTERESVLPPWRETLITLRRLEDRGEIRGGRFVDGFLGEQFALPLAVESLRASRAEPNAREIVTVSAADPLNLVGILLPGDRIPALSGKFAVYCDGALMGATDRPLPAAAAR